VRLHWLHWLHMACGRGGIGRRVGCRV